MKAIDFRKFWGSKSELRRFHDTTICEAVYFETSNIANKRLVYSQIIKHILKLFVLFNFKFKLLMFGLFLKFYFLMKDTWA